MLSLSSIHLAALALTAGAAIFDTRSGQIPNWLTLPPIAIAPFLHWHLHGLLGLAVSAAAALLCGLVPYLMFRKGAAGGGDVKLLAALGAMAGPGLGLEAQILGFGSAVVYALCLLTWRGQLLRTLKNSLLLATSPVLRRSRRKRAPAGEMTSLRMGAFFFLGTALAVWLRTPQGL